MNAGHFHKNTVSTGDLNRPRSPEVRKPLVCFLVLFAQCKKHVKTFPFREVPRFCKPQISAPQWQLRTATMKTFQGSFEVLQTSKQLAQITHSCNPIKSFCRFAASFGGKAAFETFLSESFAPAGAAFPAGNILILFVSHKKYEKNKFAKYLPESRLKG